MTALVSEIVSRVQRLISLPTDSTLFQTADYVAFINDCLIEKIYPRVMKLRDDYFLVRDVFNLQNSSAQDLYPTGVMPIPARAWGNTLREIKYIDNSGNFYKVNPYFLEDLDLYQCRNLSFSSSYQKGFIPFNSGIKLIPPPLQDNGSIEMHYIITPSQVIVGSTTNGNGDAYSEISNMQFNSSTNVASYTVSKLATDGFMDILCPVGNSILFDVYNSQTGMLMATSILLTRSADSSPTQSAFTGICTVQNGTNFISPNITEMTNFQVGGYPVSTNSYSRSLYLVVAGVCPFTPLPPVLDNLLVYEMAIKILSAQGYVEELQIFLKEHDDLRKDLLSQMAMRVECEPFVISNKRGIRSNILYGAMRGRRWR